MSRSGREKICRIVPFTRSHEGAPLTIVLLSVFFALIAVASTAALLEFRAKHVGNWFASYLRKRWVHDAPGPGTRHLMFCFVDHFEPMFERPAYEVECSRVERWVKEYTRLCEDHRDSDGRAPVHTFFYPEEEYRPEHLDNIVNLCRAGLGEVEVHLHHHDDTEEGLRAKLRSFTSTLVDRHDALPIDPATGKPRWAFIHGNWALDNSRPDGHMCGVNNELTVLREEGCYADFTFPSAPDITQPSTINSIYYATDDPSSPKSHDTGMPVQCGGRASGDLMIIQGPLGFNFASRKFGIVPRIENSDIRTTSPPARGRVDRWVRTGIQVRGKPEWTFIKIHTHGAPERDVEVLLGEKVDDLFSYLEARYNDGVDWKLHYVSAREMYNIIKAAEAGEKDDPGAYRDYLIPRPAYAPR